MQRTVTIPFMLLGLLFNICLVTSNLLETKVVQIAGITATAGLLVFPISYIINDCIVEIWGYKKIRLVIWSGFASNLLLIGFSQLAILLPSAPYWQGDEAFRFVFGLAPRIAAASLIAFLAGSFINAYVMSSMKIASKGRNFSLRAMLSTLAGEGADSIIFFPIAFGGLIPNSELLLMIGVQTALKSIYELIALPFTVVAVKRLKRMDCLTA